MTPANDNQLASALDPRHPDFNPIALAQATGLYGVRTGKGDDRSGSPARSSVSPTARDATVLDPGHPDFNPVAFAQEAGLYGIRARKSDDRSGSPAALDQRQAPHHASPTAQFGGTSERKPVSKPALRGAIPPATAGVSNQPAEFVRMQIVGKDGERALVEWQERHGSLGQPVADRRIMPSIREALFRLPNGMTANALKGNRGRFTEFHGLSVASDSLTLWGKDAVVRAASSQPIPQTVAAALAKCLRH